MQNKIKSVIKKIVIRVVKIYQLCISPFLGAYNCRFTPSCSQYMIFAIEKYGVVRGTFLGIFRILKCHPFSKGGEDPVP